jgi:hypothetical protein
VSEPKDWNENPPHRCRDGHEPIGHWDSENETCPLCRATATVDLYAEQLAGHPLDRAVPSGAGAAAREPTTTVRKALEDLLSALDHQQHGTGTPLATSKGVQVAKDVARAALRAAPAAAPGDALSDRRYWVYYNDDTNAAWHVLR